MVLMLFSVSAAFSSQVANVPPINDLPNPFRTVRNWATPPGGVPWAAVTAVEVARWQCMSFIDARETPAPEEPEPPF
jgi:hypothetical protein